MKTEAFWANTLIGLNQMELQQVKTWRDAAAFQSLLEKGAIPLLSFEKKTFYTNTYVSVKSGGQSKSHSPKYTFSIKSGKRQMLLMLFIEPEAQTFRSSKRRREQDLFIWPLRWSPQLDCPLKPTRNLWHLSIRVGRDWRCGQHSSVLATERAKKTSFSSRLGFQIDLKCRLVWPTCFVLYLVVPVHTLLTRSAHIFLFITPLFYDLTFSYMLAVWRTSIIKYVKRETALCKMNFVCRKISSMK